MKKSIKTFQQQLDSKSESIINAKVSAAIKNIISEPVLSALWNIKFYIADGSQGTSSQENVHRKLNAFKGKYSTGITWDTCMMYIASVVYQHNLQILQVQTLHSKIEEIMLLDKQAAILIDTCNFQPTTSDMVCSNIYFNNKKILQMGFIVKQPHWNWTSEETATLKQAIKNMAKQPNEIKVQNWHYYIAHYIFFWKDSSESSEKKNY